MGAVFCKKQICNSAAKSINSCVVLLTNEKVNNPFNFNIWLIKKRMYFEGRFWLIDIVITLVFLFILWIHDIAVKFGLGCNNQLKSVIATSNTPYKI